MKKKEMIKFIEELKKDSKDLAQKISDVLLMIEKSPRVSDELTCYFGDLMRHINSLDGLKIAIEKHGSEEVKVQKLYDMPEIIDDGIYFDDEEEPVEGD